MSGTHHLKIRVDAELRAALGELARRQGVSLSDAIRGLIRSATSSPATPTRDLALLGYANLLASELAVQLIASILPEGEEALPRYLEAAAEEASRRLERVELAISEGERPWRS